MTITNTQETTEISANKKWKNLDGTVDDGITDEDLPYDMKADVIRISDEQFGLFYVDSMDHPERYDGKVVSLVGQAWKRREFPKGFYYFAREAMTCCANDIAPCGWVCKGERTPDNKTYFTLLDRDEKFRGFPLFHLKDYEEGAEMWILDDPKFPLIVKMLNNPVEINWTIE